MTYNSAPIQPINPDPNILTLLAIGTAENVRAHILRQHTLSRCLEQAYPRAPLSRQSHVCTQPHHDLTRLTLRSPEPHGSEHVCLKLELVKQA